MISPPEAPIKGSEKSSGMDHSRMSSPVLKGHRIKPCCSQCGRKSITLYTRKLNCYNTVGYWCEKCSKIVDPVVRHNPIVHRVQIEEYLRNPTEKFDLILADPPWTYNVETIRTKDQISSHYSQMSTEAICNLQIQSITEENAIIFLWTSSPKLDDALKVLNSWGFKYTTSIAWNKERIGLGFNVRNQHETLLIGKKGKYPTPKYKPPSVITEKRTQHSRKPKRSYQIIEAMYPSAKRLELFARLVRPGWTGVGNEAEMYTDSLEKSVQKVRDGVN